MRKIADESMEAALIADLLTKPWTHHSRRLSGWYFSVPNVKTIDLKGTATTTDLIGLNDGHTYMLAVFCVKEHTRTFSYQPAETMEEALELFRQVTIGTPGSLQPVAEQ